MSSGGRFARIYMANDHDVDVSLFLSHSVCGEILPDEMFLRKKQHKCLKPLAQSGSTLGKQIATEERRKKPSKVFILSYFFRHVLANVFTAFQTV